MVIAGQDRNDDLFISVVQENVQHRRKSDRVLWKQENVAGIEGTRKLPYIKCLLLFIIKIITSDGMKLFVISAIQTKNTPRPDKAPDNPMGDGTTNLLVSTPVAPPWLWWRLSDNTTNKLMMCIFPFWSTYLKQSNMLSVVGVNRVLRRWPPFWNKEKLRLRLKSTLLPANGYLLTSAIPVSTRSDDKMLSVR